MKPTKSLGIGRERGQLPAVSSGLGVHFTTPTKGRRAPSRKTKKFASSALDFNAKKRRLDAQLAAVIASAAQLKDLPDLEPSEPTTEPSNYDFNPFDFESDVMDETTDNTYQSHLHLPIPQSSQSPTEPKPKRLKPDQAALNQAEKWNALLPSLIHDLHAYYKASKNHEIGSIRGGELTEPCPSSPFAVTFLGIFLMMCRLHLDHCYTLLLPHDSAGACESGLVSNCAIANSDGVLDRISGNFTRQYSKDHATPKRGFNLLNKKDEKFRKPFRKGLGYAAQWLDMLHILIDHSVEEALREADAAIQEVTKPAKDHLRSTQVTLDELDYAHAPEGLGLLDECSRFLRQLCPACFGTANFGRTFDDILTSTFSFLISTNLILQGRRFSHLHGWQFSPPSSHLRRPGYSVPHPAARRIDEARKRKPKPRTSKVPDEAIDECQDSYDAADGDKKKKKGAGQRYDAQGWMSRCTNHLVLLPCSKKMRRQMYYMTLAVSSNEAYSWYVFRGSSCLDGSKIYSPYCRSIQQRIRFCTTAMHAYVGLSASLQSSIHLRLSDGEGVERLWAMIRKLISLVRTSSVIYAQCIGLSSHEDEQAARRIWMTDRQLTFIAVVRDGLGDWIKNSLNRGVKAQGEKARLALTGLWLLLRSFKRSGSFRKKPSFLSVLSYLIFLIQRCTRPAQERNRHKKEIDTLLLQTELEGVKKAIQTTQSNLSSAPKKHRYGLRIKTSEQAFDAAISAL
ncbi:LOW QUALITY PROTEIN: hypothetical protein CVT26_016205 [Gymnopilus dilepis]|uniref:Uncharacterized protein n=1 Tax=Gymnopilus dilepis TaxID=231916 RepID=A0A409XZ41_9AGAR|nr:LOW QUALITY PROTEIN: hypothetical protein CVT26_016205 [Gymnopilus dilepis]